MWRTRITIIAAMPASLVLLSLLSLAQATYGPNAKACSLLPIADLEAHYGGKATPPQGVSGVSSGSTCSVSINSHRINIQSEPPGTAGLPRTIKEGLDGVRIILEDAKAKNTMIPLEDKDFGSVGCYSVKVNLGKFGGSKPGAWGYDTTCFLVEGGYLKLDITSEDPKDISLEVVKRFLETAAARRR
jgi:hypothetical protein